MIKKKAIIFPALLVILSALAALLGVFSHLKTNHYAINTEP